MTSNYSVNHSGTNTSSVMDSETLGELIDFVVNTRTIFAICRIAIAPVIVLVNAILIASILRSRHLRNYFRYLAMTSIALSDLFIGLVSCPVRADALLRSQYNHGCTVYLFLSVYELYVQMFVGTWAILCINFDFLLATFKIHRAQLSPLKRKTVIGVVLALPWLATFFVVLPIAYAYAEQYFTPFQLCRLIIPLKGKHVITSMTFVIPSIIILFQVAAMVLVQLRCPRTRNDVSPEALPQTWVYVIASLLTVAMISFEQISSMSIKQMLSSLHYETFSVVYNTAIVLSDAKSAVIAFVWFALPEIREALNKLFSCGRTRDSNTDTDCREPDYSNLYEEGQSGC